jgi:predicted GNAT superfamily acetyltransferase
MEKSEITIRRPHTPDEYKSLQEAQKKAWGITQDGYVVPVATMVGAQHHGGLVLGAFLPDGKAIGLSFSFLGRVHGEFCLYSQLTGVVPGYQGQGIGAQMKWAQWEYARTHQIPAIAWAFDPFQAGNAHFNIHMLRARSRRFLDDMYGPRTDALNAGVPTDRLIAEWPTSHDPRNDYWTEIDYEKTGHLIETHLTSAGYVAVAFVHETLRGDVQLLEIPDKIQVIQSQDQEQARRWRSAVREAFHKAFQEGFVVTDFIRGGTGAKRCYYRLERNVWI